MNEEDPAITQDAAFHGRVVLVQPRRGYRFSVDSVLLADFVERTHAEALDLCAGCGVVGLLLLDLGRVGKVTAVEIDGLLAELAEKNARINGWSEKYAIFQEDYRRFTPPGDRAEFDLVVANPPYYPAGSGRRNPDGKEALGRHEQAGTLEDLVEKSASCLTPKGRFCLVLPAFRLHELAVALARRGLRMKRLRAVHPRADKEAGQVLVEAVFGATTRLVVESPLIVRDENGKYTEETEAILAGNR